MCLRRLLVRPSLVHPDEVGREATSRVATRFGRLVGQPTLAADADRVTRPDGSRWAGHPRLDIQQLPSRYRPARLEHTLLGRASARGRRFSGALAPSMRGRLDRDEHDEAAERQKHDERGKLFVLWRSTAPSVESLSTSPRG